MNSDSYQSKTGVGAYVLAFIFTFLIVGFLVHLMQVRTTAPTISATRSAERMQIMTEFQAANGPLVETYGWQDEPKGFIRVPIERAKELVLQEWQNPEAARSNLMARAAIEFAPPPKVPEKKSIYE
jgi:hypothetical protein